MGELADLLELLYRADSSWRTLRLTAEEWTHVERMQRAFERAHSGEGSAQVSLYGSDARDWPRETTTEIRFWASADGRRRTEREGPGGSHTSVFDGERCWTHTPEFGAVVHDSRTMLDDVHEHVDPRGLIVVLDLTLEGQEEIAGRRALRVRGRARHSRQAGGIPPGADEVGLLVDAERGLVLASEALLEGEPVRRFSVKDIGYDEELPAATFVYEPPPGESVRTQDEAFRVDYVSLEEAAERASFTVWRPRQLAAGWRVFAIHRPRSERPRLDESVHLLFHDDATHSFTIEQAAQALLAWRRDQPEVVAREGIELRVFAGNRPGPPSEVHLEPDGTYLRLSSDSLDAAALVELAATLVPASSEPPPLLP